MRTLIPALLTFFLLSGCAGRPADLKPSPHWVAPTYRMGMVFLEGCGKSVRDLMLRDAAIFPQMTVVPQATTLDWLRQRGVEIPWLLSLDKPIDLPELGDLFDQVTVASPAGNGEILVRSYNFRRRSITAVGIAAALNSGRNWLLYSKAGWIFFNPKPLTPGLEIYLNRTHVGYSPLLLNLPDGLYQLAILGRDKVLLETSIAIPFSSEAEDLSKFSP